jgi:hypothetical protein
MTTCRSAHAIHSNPSTRMIPSSQIRQLLSKQPQPIPLLHYLPLRPYRPSLPPPLTTTNTHIVFPVPLKLLSTPLILLVHKPRLSTGQFLTPLPLTLLCLHLHLLCASRLLAKTTVTICGTSSRSAKRLEFSADGTWRVEVQFSFFGAYGFPRSNAAPHVIGVPGAYYEPAADQPTAQAMYDSAFAARKVSVIL